MALYPKNKGRFYISDVVADPVYDSSGRRVFQGFGSDYSAASNNILYITSIPLERTVPIKAFIDSIKMNLDKEVEKVTSVDSQITTIKEYSSDLSYDIKLNMPAHSTNEAANNLAKIEELQRLIMPIKARGAGLEVEGISSDTGIKKNLFSVWFKNLISSGKPTANKRLAAGGVSQVTTLLQKGFVCYIENINYEPDLEAGFFEHGGELLPRNIILNLKLNYDSNSLRQFLAKSTLEPFLANGHYEEGDTSLFPFGVVVRGEPGYPERPAAIKKSTQEFTQKQMNDLSGNRTSSYLFVALPVPQNLGNKLSKEIEHITYGGEVSEEELRMAKHNFYTSADLGRVRYVVFEPFFENFTRGVSVSITTSQEKGNSIYKEVTIGNSALNHLEYNITLGVPAKNLLEAKKNCAKIQYLCRMFLKRKQLATELGEKRKGGSGISMKQSLDASLERVKTLGRTMVYIPNKIERPGSAGLPRDFDTMYANSLPLFFEKFDVSFNMEDGFFEEGNRLFPKSMTVTLTFLEVDNNLMSTFQRVDSDDPSKGFKLANSGTELEESELELFPFNKKTNKIIIGD